MKCLGARFGVIQRTKGQSALDRSDYQKSGFVVTGTEIKLYGHVGDTLHLHQMFLPKGAPRKLDSALEMWAAAANAERRHDAVEARTVDLTLPQTLSLEANLEISRAIAQHYADQGVGVQLDVQSSIALNGSDNIHAHLLLTVRKILADGFDRLKNHELEASFWAGRLRGREMREFLTETINNIAKKYGYPAQVFAESHFELNLEPPEIRLERWVFINSQAELSIQKSAKLSKQRAERKQDQAKKDKPATKAEIADNDDDMFADFSARAERLAARESARAKRLEKEVEENNARQGEFAAELRKRREAQNLELENIRRRTASRETDAPPLPNEAADDSYKPD